MRPILRRREDYPRSGYDIPKGSASDHPLDLSIERPLPNARLWQRSVYRYWWLFLRQNEGYRNCCLSGGGGEYAEIYKDFGDVHSNRFSTWWQKTGANVFTETDDVPAERCHLTSPSVSEEVFSARRKSQRAIRVSVFDHNGSGPLLKPKYAPLGYPNLKLLHLRYKLLILVQTRPDLPLWRILDLSEGHSAGALQGIEERGQKSMVAHRYYREARCIVEYVGKGLFPVRFPSQIK